MVYARAKDSKEIAEIKKIARDIIDQASRDEDAFNHAQVCLQLGITPSFFGKELAALITAYWHLANSDSPEEARSCDIGLVTQVDSPEYESWSDALWAVAARSEKLVLSYLEDHKDHWGLDDFQVREFAHYLEKELFS